MTRKGGRNDDEQGRSRRSFMQTAGGLTILDFGLLDWFTDDDTPESAMVAIDVDEARDDYDPGTFDLFIATDTEAIYRENDDGEWNAFQTSGTTPSYSSGSKIDSSGRWNGPVVLEGVAEADLEAGVEGRVLWDDDRKVPTFDDGDDFEYPVIGDDVDKEYTHVENTTAETTVWDSSLDADSMKAGRVYEVYLLGAYTTNDGTDQFTLRLHAGGTEVSSVQSVANQVSDAPISVKHRLVVQSDGESGALIPHTEAVFDDLHSDVATLSPVALDTTQVTTLEATVEWGVAESGNTVDLLGYMKEVA